MPRTACAILPESCRQEGRMNPIRTRRAFVRGAGAGIVAPLFAAQPAAGAVIETGAGKVRGMVRNGIHSFRGIPYGASTAGKNRFMPPAKPESWTGVRDALQFGHWCPQAGSIAGASALQTSVD